MHMIIFVMSNDDDDDDDALSEGLCESKQSDSNLTIAWRSLGGRGDVRGLASGLGLGLGEVAVRD